MVDKMIEKPVSGIVQVQTPPPVQVIRAATVVKNVPGGYVGTKAK